MHPSTSIDSQSPVAATSGSPQVRLPSISAGLGPELAPPRQPPHVTPASSYHSYTTATGAHRVVNLHRSARQELMDLTMASLDREGVTRLTPVEFLTILRRSAPDLSEEEAGEVLRAYDGHVEAVLPLLGPQSAFADALSQRDVREAFEGILATLAARPALPALERFWRNASPEDTPIQVTGPAHVRAFAARIQGDFRQAEDLLRQVDDAAGLAPHHKAELLRATDSQWLALLKTVPSATRGSLARSRMSSLGPAIDTVRSRMEVHHHPTLVCIHYEQAPDERLLDLACRITDLATAPAVAGILDEIAGSSLAYHLKTCLVLKVAEKVFTLEGHTLQASHQHLMLAFSLLDTDPRDPLPGPVQELQDIFHKIMQKAAWLDRTLPVPEGISQAGASPFTGNEPSHAECLEIAAALHRGPISMAHATRLLQSVANGMAWRWPDVLKQAYLATTLRTVESLEPQRLGEGLFMLCRVYRRLAVPDVHSSHQLQMVTPSLARIQTRQQALQVQAFLAQSNLPQDVKDTLSRLAQARVRDGMAGQAATAGPFA